MGLINFFFTDKKTMGKILAQLQLLNINYNKMATKIEEIKADLESTKQSLENIANDIATLNEKIQNAVTVEELDALKTESGELAARAGELAGLTPDENVPE